MTRNRIRDYAARAAEEDRKIEQLRDGQIAVGVGRDFLAQSGMSEDELVHCVSPTFKAIPDGASGLALLGDLRFYLRRRGKRIDVGTRRDYEGCCWGEICDLLDEVYPE